MKKIAYFGVLLIGLISFSNCSETDHFGRLLERGSRNVPEDQIIDENPDPTNLPSGIPQAPTGFEYQLVTNGWQQAGEVLTQAEIVFVIDGSGSMSNDVAAVKSSLEGWVSTLKNQGVENYCLGAMSAATSANYAGKLIAGSDHGKKCVCTFGDEIVDPQTATTQFRNTLDTVLATVSGNANVEASIYSASQSMGTAKAENQAAGCFRDDATLVFVLVQDENDICYSADSGGNLFDNAFFLGAGQSFSSVSNDPLYNHADTSEGQARVNFCTSGTPNATSGLYENTVTHQTLIAQMQAYNGDLPTFGASIGDLPVTGAYPFWGGMQFSESFGYQTVDINLTQQSQAAFNAGMNAMAQDLATQISYFDNFTLSDQICDTNQDGNYQDELPYVTVKVDGQVIPNTDWTIEEQGRKIAFMQNFVWTPEVEVETSYVRCEPI